VPGIAAIGDMVDGMGKGNAQRTGHGDGVYRTDCLIARPDPF
jgi:hypothetical protein